MKVFVSVFFLLFVLVSHSQEIDYTRFVGTNITINQVAQIDKPYLLDYQFYQKKNVDSIMYKPSLIGIPENIL